MKITRLIKPSEKADEADETLVFLEKEDKATGDGLQPPTPTSEAPTPVVLPPGLRDRVVTGLVEQDLITWDQVQAAREAWTTQSEQETLWRVLARGEGIDREMVFAEAARVYAFRQETVSEHRPEAAFVRRLVESFTPEQQHRLVDLNLLPLEYEYDHQRGLLKLLLVTHDPSRPETFQFVQGLHLDHYELCYAPERSVARLLLDLFPRRNEYLDRLGDDNQAFDLGMAYEDGGRQLVDEEALDAEINRSSLINLFEAVLVEAVRLGASDIHVFPNKHRHTEIHLRIDGHLQRWHTQTTAHPEAMLAVVKDRCGNVDRFDREIAQDGFIQREVDGALIRYRVSILPITGHDRKIKSESIVIRVLDDRKIFTDLGQIGLLPVALERYHKAISQPHGMIIMTGPTGSGKSTTLVAALHHVISPTINVLTIEDPVEYVIDGVRQIKLGPRLQLENALRSVLRHDPDVVMVGEMRDRHTAELAIKLANTGHLTFSTLHTNDAPSAVSRLFKMGIEPFLIAYAINLIVAQRLLRTLCPDCKRVAANPDEVLLEGLGFTEEEILTETFYEAGHDPDCHRCKGVGYKGRQAISEALYFSREIRHLIVSAGGSIDDDALREQAVAEGMLTLRASAREAVKRGLTSPEEILRVTTEEE